VQDPAHLKTLYTDDVEFTYSHSVRADISADISNVRADILACGCSRTAWPFLCIIGKNRLCSVSRILSLVCDVFV